MVKMGKVGRGEVGGEWWGMWEGRGRLRRMG